MQRLEEKTMKKSIIFSLLLLVACSTASSQDNESKVQHLNYQGFLDKIWNFEEHSDTFIFKGHTPVIVDFYADWCGPCRRVAPIMERLAEEYDGQLTIYKVNTQEEQGLATAFRITSIPAVLFIPMEGRPFFQVGAMSESDYRRVITEHMLPH